MLMRKFLFLSIATVVFVGAPAFAQSLVVPDVSFKGIPFGTSILKFKEELPSIECNSLDATAFTCKGITEFFDTKAHFTAFFSSRGLYMVYVRIYEKDMETLFAFARDSMIKRFNFFKEARLNSFIVWDIGGKNEQAAILTKCDGKERCIQQDEPGIMVYLLDTRFNAKKSANF